MRLRGIWRSGMHAPLSSCGRRGQGWTINQLPRMRKIKSARRVTIAKQRPVILPALALSHIGPRTSQDCRVQPFLTRLVKLRAQSG